MISEYTVYFRIRCFFICFYQLDQSTEKYSSVYDNTFVYPLVQITSAEKGYHLSMVEYVEILKYVESNTESRPSHS